MSPEACFSFLTQTVARTVATIPYDTVEDRLTAFAADVNIWEFFTLTLRHEYVDLNNV